MMKLVMRKCADDCKKGTSWYKPDNATGAKCLVMAASDADRILVTIDELPREKRGNAGAILDEAFV